MKKAIEIYQKVQEELRKHNLGFMHGFNEPKSELQVLFISTDLKYPQKRVQIICDLIDLSLAETSSVYKITKYHNPKNELRWVVTFNFKNLIKEKEK